MPTGWDFAETGTNANTTYTAGTGSANSRDTYSFGAAASTERAFGGLLSGSLNPTIGASFTNNTGGVITTLAVSYTGEEWRLGTSGRSDRIDFQYSADATSLATGTPYTFKARARYSATYAQPTSLGAGATLVPLAVQVPQLAIQRSGDALRLTWPESPSARLEQAGSLAARVIWVPFQSKNSYALHYMEFFIMSPKLRVSNDAPPTSAPSTSGWLINSRAFDGLTLPPY